MSPNLASRVYKPRSAFIRTFKIIFQTTAAVRTHPRFHAAKPMCFYCQTESERSKVVNAVIFVMSIFEISLLVTFMSTFITFYDSFSTTSFAVVVMDSSRRYSLHEVDAQRDAQTNKESAEADVKLETLELVLPASI